MGIRDSIVGAVVAATQGAPKGPVPGSLGEVEMTSLEGDTLDPATLEGKAVLFVNVASKCGFTPQYEGLQALYQEKKDEGLVIIGVPCNQFGWQEPGDAEQIQSFCSLTYGVEFPILTKQNVNGSERSPLYQFLINSEVGGQNPILWNFEKFVVNRTGEVTARFGSKTKPSDSGLRDAVQAALDSKPREPS